ncbi:MULTISPECIES: hypothetical protein [unclassified Streptomyces]|uniref:hypothetical protein n=1 Tax=unclassified Streptomyces TaxID=2593676 RepID=UPI0016602963|nr:MULTISPECIES: hypothetical protein [unclassified Streptomyces]MBD0709387.1 hypothetical protein [Streptomyces sp. CBMA291]MBD0713850.1 hypothetical protein [Streptomyces sp. CBMA370]
MKKILTAVVLTCLTVSGGALAAGTASADTGGLNLPSVVPLSGLLMPKAKPGGKAPLPHASSLVGGLLPKG